MLEDRLRSWPNEFLNSDLNLTPTFQFDGGETVLAIGGEINPQTVKSAYSNGIFPWGSLYNENAWCCPAQRYVLYPQNLKIAKSLKPFINKKNYEIQMNRNFKAVLDGCKSGGRRQRKESWIFEDLYDSFLMLNKEGFTISYEIYIDGKLCGGLFGQKIGRIFSGDSMFSITPNASKLVLHYLCLSGDYDLIDCQSYTSYLESMGADFIPRKEFIQLLFQNQQGSDS